MFTATAVWLANRGMFRKPGVVALALVSIFVLPLASRAQTVSLTPSVTSPQMVGTPVTWTATVQSPVAGHVYSYRFSVVYNGASQIVQDFSPTATFTWVPHTVEGAYKFAVVARDTSTTPPYTRLPTKSVPFTLEPWVATPLAVGTVNPTSHPLVALFSGPPCTAGHEMLVRFRPASVTGNQSAASMITNPVPCSANSVNLYVAGMYPSTPYLMHWEEYSGTTLVNTGSDLSFTPGVLPASFSSKTFTVNVAPQAYDAAFPVDLFQSGATATDLLGNVIWFAPSTGAANMARMEPGGYFYEYPATNITLYDLAGNVVKQSNVEILNEQLAAKGYPVMSGFNTHEARNLPDGNIVLMGMRTVVSTTAQGGTPTNPVSIVGDMLLVVDQNFQLVWAWDSFAHEDINRAATDGDITLGGTANDWLHSNAVQGTVDGNLIMSQRSQDWVIKIDYAKGTGDGHVIWHMGAGGDFTIVNPPSGTCNVASIPGSPNVIPWFTHQHDAHFDFEDDASGDGFMTMTIFDDGNTRNMYCPGTQNSRGMVLLVDEASRQIYQETVADLGAYSFALGAAQLLNPGNGNLYASFDNGFINQGPLTQMSEVNLAGDIVYQMQTNVSSYRAYRMSNLYTPTEFEFTGSQTQGVLTPALPFDFSTGFAQNQDALVTNGTGSVAGNVLQLTDGGSQEAGSIFYGSPVNVQTFTTDFTFQLTNPKADGFTFTIQNVGPTAVGGLGGGLGYADISESVAIKFDLFNNSGEGPDSTGLYTNGANPTVPSINLTGSGIDLHSGDVIDAHITYDGTTLMLTLTDMVTKATYTAPFTINIPSAVGGSTAYVGFTGSSGALTAVQQILSWSYEPVLVPYRPAGFPSAASLTVNGSAALSGTTIELTNGDPDEAGSAFYTAPVNIQSFNTDFDFQLTNAKADGFTFTVQGDGPTALAGDGGSLGYLKMAKSVAVKFDLYSNAGEGSDSTGLYLNGANPTVPSIDLTSSGVNLHSGDMMHAHMSYDGTALTLTITDLVTNATFTQPFEVDIPSNVGGNTAYVGFTAGTGGESAVQQILNWTFE